MNAYYMYPINIKKKDVFLYFDMFRYKQIADNPTTLKSYDLYLIQPLLDLALRNICKHFKRKV
jgi:hypothetical protein